ncbi:MAG: CPBP family glutamic-type intramembrane protease [Bacilli bacterium]|nr:CPBP family glutamic-type intramembrane protease [Bacilli bacterium]
MFELFKYHTCPNCGKKHDILDEKCPHCGAINQDRSPRSGSFANQVTFGHIREFLLAIAQFIVMYGILNLIQVIMVSVILAREGSPEAAQAWINANIGVLNIGLNLTSELLCLTAFAFIMWRYIPKLINSFKNPKVLLGIPLGLAMMFISVQISNFSYMITGGASNMNSDALDGLMTQSTFIYFLFAVILAPLVEEISYRVGMFTFLKRIHPAVAYVGVAVIFGLIHMHSLTDPVEWAYFPGYAFGGLALSFIYDKFGFGGSLLAHMTNNGIAVLVSIVAMKAGI